jgi:hypothetical protein
LTPKTVAPLAGREGTADAISDSSKTNTLYPREPAAAASGRLKLSTLVLNAAFSGCT